MEILARSVKLDADPDGGFALQRLGTIKGSLATFGHHIVPSSSPAAPTRTPAVHRPAFRQALISAWIVAFVVLLVSVGALAGIAHRRQATEGPVVPPQHWSAHISGSTDANGPDPDPLPDQQPYE